MNPTIFGLAVLAGSLVLTTPSAAAPAPAGVSQQTATPAATQVAGVVRDASGAAVAGAAVVFRSVSGIEIEALTDADGRFSLTVPGAGDGLLIVRSRGFAERRVSLPATGGAADQQITLEPATLAETVTVTPTRSEQELGQVSASVSVVDRDAIRRSAAILADDVLRQVPTFSLFRRTSSLASHPTAQGVSLRGIGPSGVSRTLVLLDGVPFNDPFGGWVHWTRVPLEAADRVEIVDGSSSALYGNYAMGGVINVRTAPPTRRQLSFKTQYGNRNTPQFDVVASDIVGKLGVVVNASAFDTEGYPTVVADERGVVDTQAAVNYANVGVKLQYEVSPRLRAFFRGGYFRENRDNGKISTFDGDKEENSTRWTSASGGVHVRLPDTSSLEATLFTDVETFRSSFLAVPPATPARSIGRMSLLQTVPTTSIGGSVLWSRAFAARHLFSAGSDLRWVEGESQENVLDAQVGQTVTVERLSGGQQRSFGLFAQDLIAVSEDLNVTLSARLDRWRNYDGHNLETVIATGNPGGGHDPSLPDRSDTVISPRLAATYQLSEQANVWGSVGSGFRAPTLNELYRQFRVGTILTLANHQLGPERLVGTELGVRVMPTADVIWRATWFHNHIEDAVSNVTIATAGAQVTRERQNLGETRVAGLQTDVAYRLSPELTVSAGYLYNRATVLESDANPELVGNALPQVPRHRASFDVTYSDPRYVTLGVQFQAIGRQFDDDENLSTVPGYDEPGLPKYGVLSLTATREIGRDMEVFFGAQNLFDQEYFVGTRPTTIGAPRLVSAGIRVRLTGR